MIRLLILLATAAWAAGSELDLGRQAQLRGDSEDALRHFLAAARQDPTDPAALQGLARQYSDLSDFQPTTAERRRYAQLALDYSERADRAQPDHADHVLSIAVAYGKLSLYSDLSEKVKYSRVILEDAERAEQLDPKYAWAHHVIGRWNYEVVRLNGAARLLVRWFLGGLPPASLDTAIAELREATRLEPGEPVHWIDLGYVYAYAGDPAQARACWLRGLHTAGTQRYQLEAKAHVRKALARD